MIVSPSTASITKVIFIIVYSFTLRWFRMILETILPNFQFKKMTLSYHVYNYNDSNKDFFMCIVRNRIKNSPCTLCSESMNYLLLMLFYYFKMLDYN